MGFGTDPLYKEDEDERDWGKNDPAYIEPQSDLTPIQKLLKQHHATGDWRSCIPRYARRIGRYGSAAAARICGVYRNG